jgi:hypothetical protein
MMSAKYLAILAALEDFSGNLWVLRPPQDRQMAALQVVELERQENLCCAKTMIMLIALRKTREFCRFFKKNGMIMLIILRKTRGF